MKIDHNTTVQKDSDTSLSTENSNIIAPTDIVTNQC